MTHTAQSLEQIRHHLSRQDWLTTPKGEPRGYIQPQAIKELWFHTGTICNLSCPFCLEGSKPGDDRLNKVTLEDVQPFIDEAAALDVEKFSFTGGEPFVIRDFIKILDYALNFKPCLVLTNATAPLQSRFEDILPLKAKPYPLSFRVSLDYPNPQKHDASRGAGNFWTALQNMGTLYKQGFSVSLARQAKQDENIDKVNCAYHPFLKAVNLPLDTLIVRFPDFLPPGSMADVPHITEKCMTTYHTEEGRSNFMCSFSRMVIKKNGKMRVYSCTLVDDDEDYDVGATLAESLDVRVMLKHHRCYSCFACGASCSES